MQKQNYQILLEQTLQNITKQNPKPTLLLHSCCGPCSSYVLEYLTQYFTITIDYYNPNIAPAGRFHRRAEEQQYLIAQMGLSEKVNCIIPPFFLLFLLEMAKGREQEKEGGSRCFDCYRLRLEHAAKMAKENGFEIISQPHFPSALIKMHRC